MFILLDNHTLIWTVSELSWILAHVRYLEISYSKFLAFDISMHYYWLKFWTLKICCLYIIHNYNVKASFGKWVAEAHIYLTSWAILCSRANPGDQCLYSHDKYVANSIYLDGIHTHRDCNPCLIRHNNCDLSFFKLYWKHNFKSKL